MSDTPTSPNNDKKIELLKGQPLSWWNRPVNNEYEFRSRYDTQRRIRHNLKGSIYTLLKSVNSVHARERENIKFLPSIDIFLHVVMLKVPILLKLRLFGPFITFHFDSMETIPLFCLEDFHRLLLVSRSFVTIILKKLFIFFSRVYLHSISGHFMSYPQLRSTHSLLQTLIR